jgi:small subunit ribosomal protein S16
VSATTWIIVNATAGWLLPLPSDRTSRLHLCTCGKSLISPYLMGWECAGAIPIRTAVAGNRRLAAGQSRDDSREFAERKRNPVLMIRLARFGARKQPYYRVVVIEKDRARNGRSLEVVGTYNPRTNPASVLLKKDRIEHWTSRGAQLSDRVAKLLKAYKEVPAATPAA